MRISRSRPLRMGVVAVAGASLLLTACGDSSDSSSGGDGGSGGASGETSGNTDATGVTDSAIKIGTHQPLTGVAAPGYSDIAPGAQAYYDFVNAAGGINGRQIEFEVRDDTYNPTTTGTVVNELVLQEQVFGIVHGLGTPTHSAVIDQLNQDEVPDLFVSSGALAWDNPEENPYTFGWQPDYEVEGKIIGQYIAENFPDAKVGLYLQGDDLGRDGATGLKRYIEDQIVAEQEYTSGNTNVAPQIGALQAAGADLIVGFNTPAYTALSQLVAQQLNFKPQWFYSNVALDPQLVGGLLANFSDGKVTPEAGVALLNGLYTTKYFATVDETGDPWVQLWQRVWEAHGDGTPLTNFNVYGMAQAYTFVQSLVAAGDDLTRGSIVAAIEENGTSFEGPAYAPFDYSAESHRGISGVQVVQIEGASLNELTPTLITDGGDAEIQEDAADGADDDAPPASGIPE